MNSNEDLYNQIEYSKKLSFKNPTQAFEMGQAAYTLAKINALKIEEAHALVAMALACRSMSKLEECYNYAFDASKLYEACGDSAGIAVTYNLIGVVYFYYAMYEQALEYFIKARHLLQDSKDLVTVSRVLNNMGEVYREVDNYREAIVIYEEALELCEKHQFTLNKAVILQNLGEVYFRLKDFDQSNAFYKMSYEILVQNEDITALSEVENRMGKIYFIQKDHKKARDMYVNALAKLNKLENKYFAIDVLINLAEMEIEEDEEAFKRNLELALEYSIYINARKKMSTIYKMYADYYEDKGDYSLSLEYFKKYHYKELEIESTMVSNKLEIIKLELNKIFTGGEVEKITRINHQLTQDIRSQKNLLEELEKVNQYLKVEVLSDELTQIANRRGVKNYLTKKWQADEGVNNWTALLIMDIDFFKRYNDYHGHVAGDQCLKKIAQALQTIFHSYKGIIGRYGGEEFVCFIEDFDKNQVAEIAESMRQAVENLKLEYEWNNAMYHLTISVGGVSGPMRNFQKSEELLLIADQQLYKAKDEGRNRVYLKG